MTHTISMLAASASPLPLLPNNNYNIDFTPSPAPSDITPTPVTRTVRSPPRTQPLHPSPPSIFSPPERKQAYLASDYTQGAKTPTACSTAAMFRAPNDLAALGLSTRAPNDLTALGLSTRVPNDLTALGLSNGVAAGLFRPGFSAAAAAYTPPAHAYTSLLQSTSLLASQIQSGKLVSVA